MTDMVCVFCRSSESLTREHVFPVWVGKRLGEGPVTHSYIPWKAEKPTRSYGSKELAITARAVCKRCNSGWMADLEAHAAPVLGPLIDGEERLVTVSDRELIGIWTMKTILMIQQAMPADSRASSSADYEDFFTRRQPPRDSTMWIVASQEHHAGSTGPLSSTLTRGVHPPERFWVAFLYLGHLDIVVVGPGLSSPPALRPGSSEWAMPIWPGLKPERWQPVHRLSREQISLLPQIFLSFLYLPAHGQPPPTVELVL